MGFYMCIVFLICAVSGISSKSTHEKLLVVSYDGFRFDYLDLYKNVTPVLNKLKASSSYAQCLLNVFPTQTFPNHFSIATGLYSGVHGVLGSNVFDKESNTVLHYGHKLFHYNEDIIPIWALNERAGEGRHSGTMMWPGSDYEYVKINSTFNFIYNNKVSFETRVAKALEWFTHEITPANFVMIYFQEPDGASHAFGPNSPENIEQIKRVDSITEYIIDSLKNNNLSDVNIVFLSDHGMEGVTLDRIIDLTPIVGDIADMYGTSPVLQIYPKSGTTVTEVYNKLKTASNQNSHFKVYLQAEIPEHFQIKDCKRSPPILAVADPPYAFQDLYEGIEWQVKNRNAPRNGTYGVHGYDPLSVNMHPYFIAHGPLFKENFYAGELKTVDMFSLFAHILKLEEPKAVKTNGTYADVAKIFKSSSAPENVVFHAYILSGSILCIVGIFATAAFCLKKRKRKDMDPVEDVEVEKLLYSSNA